MINYNFVCTPQNIVTYLKFIKVTTLTNAECRKHFNNYIPPVHDFDNICAYSGKYGNGLCSGDSGGPLVAENKLIGVSSWAAGCGEGLPDGYTRTSTFFRWVNRKIRANVASNAKLER